MRVFIPTYNRYQPERADTVNNWPEGLRAELVVRPGQESEYAALVREHPTRDLALLPIGEEGIARTRAAIVREAGAERFAMVDDDLEFRVRRPDHPLGYMRGAEAADVIEMFRELERALTEDGLAHAAISGREGNNRILEDYVEVARGIRLVAYDGAVLEREELQFRSELEGREDLDMTLRLLRRGYANRVYYCWAQGQRSSNSPGGLSDTDARDTDEMERTARALAEAHPGFVRVSERETKMSWGGGRRYDVTCYWKDAFLSHQQRSLPLEGKGQ